jgi:hypothetical protein
VTIRRQLEAAQAHEAELEAEVVRLQHLQKRLASERTPLSPEQLDSRAKLLEASLKRARRHIGGTVVAAALDESYRRCWFALRSNALEARAVRSAALAGEGAGAVGMPGRASAPLPDLTAEGAAFEIQQLREQLEAADLQVGTLQEDLDARRREDAQLEMGSEPAEDSSAQPHSAVVTIRRQLEAARAHEAKLEAEVARLHAEEESREAESLAERRSFTQLIGQV